MSRQVRKHRSFDASIHSAELIAFMEAYDDDDLPDGAWQAVLEEGAQQWAEQKGVHIDTNDAFHLYVRSKA